MNRAVVCCMLALAVALAAILVALSRATLAPGTEQTPTASAPMAVLTTASWAMDSTRVLAAASERTATAWASPVEVAPASAVTFVLDGAAPDELGGVATVRRRDGSALDLPFTSGRFTAMDRDTLDGVAVRVPGFAVAWAALDRRRAQIEVPMQRAGSIRVLLTDSSGAPLADRFVWCMCQASDVTRTGNQRGNYQANSHAVTDAAGVATLECLVPGRYDLGTCTLGEWDAARAERVIVAAGCITTQDLVAPLLLPASYGGFEFTRPAGSAFVPAAHGDIVDFVFVTDVGSYPLHRLGDRVRCIARGRQGDQRTGRIVALDPEGRPRPDLRRSTPIAITIGAVCSWQPAWER